MASAAAAVARAVRVGRDDAEHEGLIVSIFGGGAGVDAELDDGVAPGSRAEDVAHIGNGMSEGGALLVSCEIVAERAPGPRGSLVEELSEGVDCVA